MVLIANCGEIIPPFLKLRDGILPDDGLFDVVVVNAATVVEGMDVLWRMLTGRVDTDERLWFARGRHVSVETDRPRPVQLDGDPCGSTPLSVRILPAAMNVVLPRKS
jgi:diacylglycerol kinase family enzyme